MQPDAFMLQLLSRVRRRLTLRTFVRAVAACFVGLAGLLVALLLLVWLGAAVPGWLASPLSWGAALVLAVAACAGAAWRRLPTQLDAARVVERSAGLAERLSTSVEVAGRPDPLAVALRADAEERLRGVEARRVVPLTLGRGTSRWLLGSLSVLAAVVGVVRLVPPPQVVAGGVGARPGVGELSEGTVQGADFIQQLLATSTPEVRPSTANTSRRNALPDDELQALATQQGGAQERPAGTSVQQAPAVSGAAVAPDRTVTAAMEANLVDRAVDLGPVTGAAQPQSSAPPATPPGGEAVPLSPRNDGTTNPSYNQAAVRDQELREYARRRQAGGGPGGGDGDQVAMADAAVAGSATAGFDGGGAGEPPPLPGAGDPEELDLPDITDSSGRRVTLERLPDLAVDVPLGWLPGSGDWSPGVEPAVSHELVLETDLDLLRRYNTPGADQAP